MRPVSRRAFLALSFLVLVACRATAAEGERRLLYVAEPGIRNYLEYGGHGILVFDIDDGHRFVRRIATKGLGPGGKPDNVKGICASAATGRVYVSTIRTLTCLDLTNDRVLWEHPYDGGCDRMSISPDGKVFTSPHLRRITGTSSMPATATSSRRSSPGRARITRSTASTASMFIWPACDPPC